ncbi:hypothetical protein HMPREF1556_00911 [Porphyromonas sp. oral taxon 278 str. W7784]|nr:hypothetical protein HMPREF1556_00911 [Porphyromonas sp. oral taxon 278 str. W7784]
MSSPSLSFIWTEEGQILTGSTSAFVHQGGWRSGLADPDFFLPESRTFVGRKSKAPSNSPLIYLI